MITPRGVSIATATQSGMLCVTRINSTVNDPTCTRSRGRTRPATPPPPPPQPRSTRLVVFFELRFHERQRQGGAIHGTVDVGQNVCNGADVILVSMGQHQRRQLVLLELPQIRNDQIDTEQLRLRKHDAGIDQDGGVAAGDDHHVHAELAQAPERNQLERWITRQYSLRGASPLRLADTLSRALVRLAATDIR